MRSKWVLQPRRSAWSSRASSAVQSPASHRCVTTSPDPSTPDPVVGLSDDPAEKPTDDISHVGLLRTILVLNVVILIGYALDDVVAETGVKLPLFVVCLLVGIIVTNTTPRMFPRIEWPTRTRALALYLRFVAQYLPGDVDDEHAALDAWRAWARARRYLGGTDGSDSRLHHLRRLWSWSEVMRPP